MLSSDMPVTCINGVGEKRAALYKKLGIFCIGDLIRHFPRAYIDLTNTLSIASRHIGDTVTVAASVTQKLPPQRVKGGMMIYKSIITDDEGTCCTVTFFNNKYAYNALKQGEKFVFHARLSGSLLYPEMSVPMVVPKNDADRLIPVYSLTHGLSAKMIASNIKSALSELDTEKLICLPADILKKEGFLNPGAAFEEIHFPKRLDYAERAKSMFILEELTCLQLGMSGYKRRARKNAALTLGKVDLTPFYSSLPFSPTKSQLNAISTALTDMQSGKNMNRLLQGDVGSGKTLVAAALFYAVCKSGGQCAIMAPTEILANQHHINISKLLSPFNIRVSLLTGSMTASQKKNVGTMLEDGSVQVICGTHALLEKNVHFKHLAFVVADEQHRFGVSQRAALISKGSYPHTLIMSATPIPRSLALTIFGDLDISVLDEMPVGRKPIKTYLIDNDKRTRAFGFIKKQLDAGGKAYIVCPSISNDDGTADTESVIDYHKKLSGYFPDVKAAVLHGKMKPAEKEAVMESFKNGDTGILVSTTVIEVGVDVESASIIMVENAERFGLSQLHQLRGRVGRGKKQAYCILVSDNHSEQSLKRLSILCNSSDGFEIAKFDLSQRGPGDFFGDRQHGLPDLKTASLLSDSKMLEKAQEYSAQILKDDPELKAPENEPLKQRVNSLFRPLGHTRIN